MSLGMSSRSWRMLAERENNDEAIQNRRLYYVISTLNAMLLTGATAAVLFIWWVLMGRLAVIEQNQDQIKQQQDAIVVKLRIAPADVLAKVERLEAEIKRLKHDRADP